MKISTRIKVAAVSITLLSAGAIATVAFANHSWGGYHWARTANQFTLKLGNNVSSAWTANLAVASNDWNVSAVLDTTVVAGQTDPRKCRPTASRVEVCSNKYGRTGWLGLAQIWVNGVHITQGVTKLNDTYFSAAPYNTNAWKQLVTCQEVGHTFGLSHQDENFTNANLGTCMDYTNDPDGTLATPNQLSNEHPNQHDYDELDTIIYAHTDSFTTILEKLSKTFFPATIANAANNDNDESSEWGKVIRKSQDGHNSLYERDLGKGQKIFTFVIWVN